MKVVGVSFLILFQIIITVTTVFGSGPSTHPGYNPSYGSKRGPTYQSSTQGADAANSHPLNNHPGYVPPAASHVSLEMQPVSYSDNGGQVSKTKSKLKVPRLSLSRKEMKVIGKTRNLISIFDEC